MKQVKYYFKIFMLSTTLPLKTHFLYGILTGIFSINFLFTSKKKSEVKIYFDLYLKKNGKCTVVFYLWFDTGVGWSWCILAFEVQSTSVHVFVCARSLKKNWCSSPAAIQNILKYLIYFLKWIDYWIFIIFGTVSAHDV